MNKDFYLDLLMATLGGGYADYDKLIDYVEKAEKFNIDLDRIIENAEQLGDKIDFSAILYSTLDLIFQHITDEALEIANKNQKEKLENLRDNFSPFINYLDTWFNNVFDDLDFSKEKDEIIKELLATI